MKPVNLLPASCVERACRLRVARAWCWSLLGLGAAAFGAAACVLGAGTGVLPEWADLAVAQVAPGAPGVSPAGAGGASAQTIATRTVMTRTALERERTRADALKRQLMDAGRRAALIEAVSDHPDWSRLLSLIGALKGDSVLIGALDVHATTMQPTGTAPQGSSPGTPSRPGGTAQATKQPAPGRMYLVKVSGSARTPAEATQFALRLETTGLFERVTLVETQPSEVAGVAASAFRLECELAERSSRAVALQPAPQEAP